MKKGKTRTEQVVAGLLAKSRNDSAFALRMIEDLDGVVRELNVKVDPTDDAYKELALKIYHFKHSSLSQFIDSAGKDLVGHLDEGLIRDAFADNAFYFM